MTDEEVAWLGISGLRALLDRGKIGSVELLDILLARVERLNPALNAIVELDLDRARESVRAADGRRSPAEPAGPLAGIPMTVKESFDVAGLRTSRGVPEHRDRIADADATAVERLKDAGAVIFGKTNVPYNLADYQSYNDIHGLTRNPWNLDRTPGGSSGGSAAALAAGLTPVELGGDLGGSIRVPAHCCGVFGHRPSYGLIPFGRFSPEQPVPPIDIAVAGPMARSAEDLRTLFDLLVGPDAMESRAWALALQEPRARALRDFRVSVWLEEQAFPVDSLVRGVIERFVADLEREGPTVSQLRPPLDPKACLRLYRRMIRSATSARLPAAALEEQRRAYLASPDPESEDELHGVFFSHREWLLAHEERSGLRWKLASFFDATDILICPALPVTAFPHDHERDFSKRRLIVDGVERPYWERLFWSAPAGLAGLPSTTIPVGVAEDGLPVGVQVIGGPYQDLTTLEFARLVERELRPFTKPGGVHAARASADARSSG